MESILGAKFLFGKDEIAGININSIMFEVDNVKMTMTIWPEIVSRDNIENLNFMNFLGVRELQKCKKDKNLKIHYTEIVSISHKKRELYVNHTFVTRRERR